MNIEQERAAFEAWAEENLSDGIGRHSEYAQGLSTVIPATPSSGVMPSPPP